MSSVRVQWNGEQVEAAMERAFDRGLQAACIAIQTAIVVKLSRMGGSKTSTENVRNYLNKQKWRAKMGRKKDKRSAIDPAERRSFKAFEKVGKTWVDKAGGSPRQRTGILRNSIQYERRGDKQYVVGSTMPTKTGYAAIHEFGGIIKPVRAKFLSFVLGGKRIFTKKVVIPARPFMRPGFTESKDKAVAEFTRAFRSAMKVSEDTGQ